MAWIECNQEISRHPKTKRLVRYLEISIPEAIGHLICMWHCALDFAQDGDLTNFSPEDIAEMAMWEGDPKKFLEAMIKSGYMDQSEDNRIVIHDWYDYAGKLIDKRKEDAERKRTSRGKRENKSDVQRMSDGCPADVQRMSDDVQRMSDVTLTVQYSNSNSTKEKEAAAARAKPIYQHYEQNIGPINPTIAEAIKSWSEVMQAEVICAAISEAAKNHARWRYADAILRDCHNSNVHTLEAWEARQKQRESTHGAVRAKQEPQPADSHTYTLEEIKRLEAEWSGEKPD